MQINLLKNMFNSQSFQLVKNDKMSAELFRYSTGIEAVKITNEKGHLIILPYMGQMIWDATFCGVDLKMQSMFKEPVPASDILGTYGCFMYHAGILRNGNPTQDDAHNLHGEFPCAKAQNAYLKIGKKDGKSYICITSEYEYIKGFGDHYMASPSVTLFEDSSVFDINMHIKNLATKPMDVMYMNHINNAFVEGATIHQMSDYNNNNMQLRESIPSHVQPTKDWLDFLKQAKDTPSISKTLVEPQRYDPEIVYFIKNMQTDSDGYTHLFMEYPNGDGQYCKYKPSQMPHLTRWILYNGDQKVAAFALPGTCDPEGYSTEKQKGNVMSLAASASIEFSVTTGYIEKENSKIIKDIIGKV